IAQGQIGRVLHIAPAPDGTKVALISHDGRILIVTIADGAIREIGKSLEGEANGLAWSPDSRYVVWRSPMATGEAMI
ncbi:hypothetical protein, partial [Acinetobacter baumannii]